MSDDRLGYGDPEESVTDEAVIGEDEILCFTPCHRRAIRLDASEFERWGVRSGDVPAVLGDLDGPVPRAGTGAQAPGGMEPVTSRWLFAGPVGPEVCCRAADTVFPNCVCVGR